MFGKKGTVGGIQPPLNFSPPLFLEGFLHAAPSRSNSFPLSRMKNHVHANNIPNSQICAKIAATATFHCNTQKFTFARPPFRDWRIWSFLHSTAGWASHDRKGNVSWTNYLPCWSSLQFVGNENYPKSRHRIVFTFFIPEQVNHVYNLGAFYRYCVSSLLKLYDFYCKFSTMLLLLL